ncbi:type II secretion system F family protein [Candidatus Vampirococcus lugosii]|uniref:Type II secretion system F domain protein n=1 Tax=Candidatus Vampirococcus lugosii TaxID=2789015 RepID=A0ABS5QMN3_9BACT|nr:type II secretion system F family protein [Candidatus Vampirococcus lugosii]MBS8122462.1 type II secretion system F domain protein [Candidatus Vampirococcus lugosii]
MDIKKLINYISKNIDYISNDDITMIIDGKYNDFFKSINDKYVKEKDKKKKKKYLEIIEFINIFLEDYEKNGYKYNYDLSKEYEHFLYWFNYYLNNNKLTKVNQVINDIEKYFGQEYSSKLYKKYNKIKQRYELEQKKIEIKSIKNNELKTIEKLIANGNYSEAMSSCLKYAQEYDDEKTINKYIDKINQNKTNKLYEHTKDDNKDFFEKIGMIDIYKGNKDKDNGNFKKNDIKFLYKKLDNLYSNSHLEDGISLINYMSETYELYDKKLSKYKSKFLDKKREIESNSQKNDYNFELNSLRLMFKNKQYQDCLIKANNILKRYPMISKIEILNIIKKVKKEKYNITKNSGKQSFEAKVENFLINLSNLNKKGIDEFYTKMAWFLGANMDLKLSIQVIYAQTKDYGLKKFIREMLEGIDTGIKMSDIMKWYKQISEMDISLVKIGENTGKLGDMFESIAKHKEEASERRKKIKSVMIYPIIVISITIIIFIGLLVFVLPQFTTLFNQVGMEMPALTQAMMSISNFLKTKYYLVILFIVLSIMFFKFLGKTNIGKYIYSYMALKMPVVKEVVYRNYVIHLMGNLSLMLNAGINLLEALDIVASGTANKLYKDEFRRIRFELESGITFSKAVGLGGVNNASNYNNIYVPIDGAYAIDIGERTGQLGKLLGDTADRYDKDLKLIIKNLQSLMEPFVILLVGGVVFMFVLSIFLPMIQMYQAIGSL